MQRTSKFANKFVNHPWQEIAKTCLAIALVWFACLAIAPAALATGVEDLPYLTQMDGDARVIDEGEVFSRITETQLTEAAQAIEQTSGVSLRYVTIRRLDFGTTIDNFADGLFDKWFPTPEEKAQQVLLVLDVVTNTSAIRTGSGVEELLPDDIAESVASDTVLAALRDGNQYNQAFLNASDRLVAVLSGEADPGPPEEANTLNVERTYATAEETDDVSATWIVVVLLVLATVIPMATYFFYQGFN